MTVRPIWNREIIRTTKNKFHKEGSSCPYSPCGFGRCGVWVPAR